MKSDTVFELPAQIEPSWKIGIVTAQFHADCTHAMADAAVQTLEQAGISSAGITKYEVLGSFEIPLLGAALAKSRTVDALIGLGVIVQGETFHADHLAREAVRGMMDIQLQYGIPFAYEILHVHTLVDAQERKGKGKEAAIAVLHSLAELARIPS